MHALLSCVVLVVTETGKHVYAILCIAKRTKMPALYHSSERFFYSNFAKHKLAQMYKLTQNVLSLRYYSKAVTMYNYWVLKS